MMKMTRLFSILSTLAVVTTITGCDDGDDDPNNPGGGSGGNTEYSITVTSGGNDPAWATLDGTGDAITKAKAGTTVELTTSVHTNGVVFWRWTVISGDVTLSDRWASGATFTMPTGAVEIKAEFSAIETTSAEINGVTWAACNVDAFGKFATNPESYGMFYQWNRTTGWSSTDPPISSPVGMDWEWTTPDGDSWDAANDPCPTGWRVPTKEEQEKLLTSDKVSNKWTSLDHIYGRVFTDKSSSKSIFFPAAGARSYKNDNGELVSGYGGGDYWSSSPSSTNDVWHLHIYSYDAVMHDNSRKTNGQSVRCVLK